MIRHTHRLVSAIDRIADVTLREESDLSLSHFRMMLAIHKELGSQQEIASFWGITPAAVSRQVHLLKEKGLVKEGVKEHVKGESSRKHAITLTAAGVQKMKKMFLIIDRVFEAAFSRVSEKDKMVTEKTLVEMRAGLATHPALKKLDELCDGVGAGDRN